MINSKFNKKISKTNKMFFNFSMFVLGLGFYGQAHSVEAPSVKYKQVVISNGSPVADLFTLRALESGYSIDYQTRAGIVNIMEYVVEYPDSTGYVSIEKAYSFADNYILVISTGENGASCPATTYAVSIDSEKEMVTGVQEVQGCSENIETFSDKNKLIIKKEEDSIIVYNGKIEKPALTPNKSFQDKGEVPQQGGSTIEIRLLADVEWLPEGSGVLLSTDKGYINGYSTSMMDVLGEAKKGECFYLASESGNKITVHQKKYPGLEAVMNETEDLIAKKIPCY